MPSAVQVSRRRVQGLDGTDKKDGLAEPSPSLEVRFWEGICLGHCPIRGPHHQNRFAWPTSAKIPRLLTSVIS